MTNVVSSSGNPYATSLWTLAARLDRIGSGASRESAGPLISEGRRLIRARSAVRDSTEWAVATAAEAAFFEAASAHQPTLLATATRFRETLVRAGVTVGPAGKTSPGGQELVVKRDEEGRIAAIVERPAPARESVEALPLDKPARRLGFQAPTQGDTR